MRVGASHQTTNTYSSILAVPDLINVYRFLRKPSIWIAYCIIAVLPLAIAPSSPSASLVLLSERSFHIRLSWSSVDNAWNEFTTASNCVIFVSIAQAFFRAQENHELYLLCQLDWRSFINVSTLKFSSSNIRFALVFASTTPNCFLNSFPCSSR